MADILFPIYKIVDLKLMTVKELTKYFPHIYRIFINYTILHTSLNNVCDLHMKKSKLGENTDQFGGKFRTCGTPIFGSVLHTYTSPDLGSVGDLSSRETSVQKCEVSNWSSRAAILQVGVK